MRKVALLLASSLGACSIRKPIAKGEGQQSSRLTKVLARGRLICGVEGRIPGFSYIGTDGNYSGLDVDTCKAVAAALFDDPGAVDYRPLDSSERFTALSSGEVDMLARNTTWTLSRDAAGGNNLEFAPTTFYDGQGMLVTQRSGVKGLRDLQGKSICVETGTTTELNLADRMAQLGVTYQEVKFPNSDATYAAYEQGRCEGVSSDRSQLAARRSKMANPDDHVLLPDVLSKEPLGPVTVNNDSRWFDVVKWVTFALFQAEEFGITQANVGQQRQSTAPSWAWRGNWADSWASLPTSQPGRSPPSATTARSSSAMSVVTRRCSWTAASTVSTATAA